MGASIPVGPGTWNGLPITYPSIVAPACDAGLTWANGGPGSDGGCVAAGGAINQLTGQVTAGPGAGSQTATLVIPQANQLFIATNGSDSNPCNIANPCATYAHTAAAAVTAGATATNLYAIIYGPGKFSENIAFVNGTVVVGSVGFDQPLTSFTGSSFTLGTSFTGSGLAGGGISGVTFAPTGSFALDLNFVGVLSTNSFFDIANSTMSGTLTVEGYTGTTVQIYSSYAVSFTITNAGTFTSWNNEMVGPLTTNCTTGACGWQSQNDAIVGNVLLEGSQANTTTFENVGFRGGLTLSGTASTFAGDIGSIPTSGVTYAGGATSAQYVISGLLPVTNLTPSDGGSILVLTSDGGSVYWSSGAVDGGGITQLTGPVTAGPGTGSQATAINFGGGSLSGKLPIANLAACTSAQILESNATPTQTCTSVTGDLSLSATGVATVVALQTNAVASGALTKGDALFATSTSTWAEAAFGGDLTCSTVTPGSCTLGSIDGKSLPSPPSTGTTVLTDTTGSLTWSSGSGTSVTGTGIWYSASGTLNSAAVGCTGDVTCSAALSSGNLPYVVTDIHGASVPVAGSLTTGNVLQVSAASVDTYGPVNLAGGANFVTGNLPTGNVSPGTSAQVMMSNGTPATTWTTVTGDTTISATGVTATGKINGASVPAAGSLVTGNVLQVSGASSLTYAALSLSVGSLTNTNISGGDQDLNSLIWGDISQAEVSAFTGFGSSAAPLTVSPHIQANVVGTLTPDGYGDAVWVNENAVATAMAQKGYFTPPTGTTAVNFTAIAQLPVTGVSATTIVLQIQTASGGGPVSTSSCTLTSSWQTCATGATTVTPGTTYLWAILYNQGASSGTPAAEALIARIAVVPTTTTTSLLTSPFIRINASSHLLWNNGVDQLYELASTGVVRQQGSMSRLVFRTNASSFAVQTFNTDGSGAADYNGILVNGKPFAWWIGGFQIYDYNVISGLPAGSNNVEVIVGGSGETFGDYVTSVILPATADVQVRPPSMEQKKKIVVIGDSKCNGYGSTVPPLTGIPGQMRTRFTSAEWQSECNVGELLYTQAFNDPTMASFVQHIAMQHPTFVVDQLLRNDWSSGSQTLANFSLTYQRWLDFEHQAMPNAMIIVWPTSLESPTIEASTNSNGNTLPQYRTVAVNACQATDATGRAIRPWCLVLDGTTVPNYNPVSGNDTNDNTHPNNTGAGKVADHLFAQMQFVNYGAEPWSVGYPIGIYGSGALSGVYPTIGTVFEGTLQRQTQTVSSNYTFDTASPVTGQAPGDHVVFVSATATITLPTPALVGREACVKNTGSGTITLAPHASESIDGTAGSYVFTTPKGWLCVLSDGTNWWTE
jgi:lysophospholipase L1-like esterase